jgi:hypothetical protein
MGWIDRHWQVWLWICIVLPGRQLLQYFQSTSFKKYVCLFFSGWYVPCHSLPDSKQFHIRCSFPGVAIQCSMLRPQFHSDGEQVSDLRRRIKLKCMRSQISDHRNWNDGMLWLLCSYYVMFCFNLKHLVPKLYILCGVFPSILQI